MRPMNQYYCINCGELLTCEHCGQSRAECSRCGRNQNELFVSITAAGAEWPRPKSERGGVRPQEPSGS